MATRRLLEEPTEQISFIGEVICWFGPAPYFFIPVPPTYTGIIKYAAQKTSYGWGIVPVEATIGSTTFTTSLIPKDGAYLLPLKAKVRERADAQLGMQVSVSIRV